MVFFFPKTIETRTSQVNGQIKVVKLFGTYRLVAGGYTQSGGLIHTIWKKVLKRIAKDLKIKEPKILLLGLGAGSAAQLSHNLWPDAQITALELDPVMIELGKKYFNLDNISNVRIINNDAIDWVIKKSTKQSRERFRLILVDLYVGGDPAPAMNQDAFLSAISRLLEEKGIALFNRLIKSGEKREMKNFKKKLSELFDNVERIPSPANAVFAVKKQQKIRPEE
ncbi:hypothetical protein IH980_04215 [Patescibacteria group bacterium]|nr:hypothetical protein [Patescibacteria group bacterium]